MKKILLLTLWLGFLAPSNSYGQLIKTKLDFAGGIGFPEFIHAGARYQYSDVAQIGIFYGGDMNLKPTIIRTVSLEHLYHFGKNSYNSNRPIWYAKGGICSSNHDESERTYNFIYLMLTAGRDFAINNWLGFNVEMGGVFQVRERLEFKNSPGEYSYRKEINTSPTIRIQFYISL